MRRADRLFRIVQLLRLGRLKTARALAERLQVSERTIYRDIRDLQRAGQPIEGEPGMGYTLRRDFDLPPLLFTAEELTALVLGGRLVQAWAGRQIADAASSALVRIEAVLPADLAAHLESIALYAPAYQMQEPQRLTLDSLHDACIHRKVLQFRYRHVGETQTQGEVRSVRPLALAFWSGGWTLAAWCETRDDFRNFRVDHMEAVTILERIFVQKRGQRLEDYLRRVRAEGFRHSASSPKRA